MKNCKLLLFLFVATMISMPVFAQKSARKVAKETASAVTKLDAKQQQMILNFTRSLTKGDVKKEMKKSMKKMSSADQQKVLDFIAKMNPPAATKKVAPKKGAPQKAVAKTSGNKYNVDTSKAGIANKPATTQIEILDKTFDFGTIQQGEKASYIYKIKNIGKVPLVITKAKGSCGCTVPKWPKEAVAPGEIAEIDVVFNSRGKKGKQNKRITITANTDPAQNFMTITGMVEVPAKTDAPAKKKQ